MKKSAATVNTISSKPDFIRATTRGPSGNLNQLHSWQLRTAELTWRKACEGDYKSARTELKAQIARAFSGGDVQGVLSTDNVETLRSLAEWKALAYDVKVAALKQRDEWKALVTLRIELGLAHVDPAGCAKYLQLSVRNMAILDKLITAYLERPLRFCTANYRQPLKPTGSNRKRPRLGWAVDVLRRRIHQIGQLETRLKAAIPAG
jgi:hypothetical protein